MCNKWIRTCSARLIVRGTNTSITTAIRTVDQNIKCHSLHRQKKKPLRIRRLSPVVAVGMATSETHLANVTGTKTQTVMSYCTVCIRFAVRLNSGLFEHTVMEPNCLCFIIAAPLGPSVPSELSGAAFVSACHLPLRESEPTAPYLHFNFRAPCQAH